MIHLVWILIVFIGGCTKNAAINPETARLMITHRNLGLAYLEENKLPAAKAEFQSLIEIAPREPLGYADLGLTYLRLGDYEQAEKQLQKAVRLAPKNPDTRILLAEVLRSTNRENQAIRILEKTLRYYPYHVRTQYQLVMYNANSGNPETQQKTEEYLTRIVNTLPANVAARLQLMERLLQNEKIDLALEHLETILQILPQLPENSNELLQTSMELMRTENIDQAIVPTAMFHNLLKSTAFYQAAMNELRGKSGSAIGVPIQRFSQDIASHNREQIGIPVTVNFTDITATSGLEIIYNSDIVKSSEDHPDLIIAHGDYNSDGNIDLFVSRWSNKDQTSKQYLFSNNNGTFVEIIAGAGIHHSGRDLSAQFADYDNDGYLDLFITNSITNRLYHNTGEGTFQDVTIISGIRTIAPTQAAVFVDLDLEGDLDLFIATQSKNQLYRNNLDGTFFEITDEAGISSEEKISRDAKFGDFDEDGDIDLLVINQDGRNRFYDNLRQSFFRDISEYSGLDTEIRVGAVAVGDYNNDGYLDLFFTDLDGIRHSLFRNLEDGTFERDSRSDIVFQNGTDISGQDAVFFDFNNDGYLDLLLAGTSVSSTLKPAGLRLFYNKGNGEYLDASSLLPDNLTGCDQVEVADYDNDGDQDIFTVSSNGIIHLLRNDGGNINNYLIVKLAGLRTGSGKNNYYGIGAKVEVKAGTLYQMRLMNEPIAHFGLGNLESADVVRVVWSNGVPQNRFNPERNQTIVENQILKGSCPWLYVWNGSEYEFATDVLWPSALGMPLGIMGKEMAFAFANSTDEYLKIPSNKLQPKNDSYSLQFTSELWETPYVDRIELLIVDHPEKVDIFIDEKFTPPPFPPFRIYEIVDKYLPVSARDGNGNNILPEISNRDGIYVSNLTPSRFQGIMEPHEMILDLGNIASADSIFLFLQGWVFPTDASINVNMSQSGAVKSIAPSLQIIDDQGNWKTAIEFIGFPKGKNKTMVLDLSGKFETDDYRVRINTNMQIYWDYIFYATSVTGNSLQLTSLEPTKADLHYRGFSEVTRETPYSPHIPDYRTVTTTPRWRDLTGQCTRYGDVFPLLRESDNKYVIMNAGDELTLEFETTRLPSLPAGWKRDFIFYNDGWLKDGDLNTAQGQTVKPLPFHDMTSYPYDPRESYPGDEEHVTYLQKYNTRKITTEEFKQFLFDIKTK